MSDLIETPDGLPKSRLNSAIAILVALSASLTTLFNIKDNNVVQAMSQAQAHAIDAWSFYQAKSTKAHLAEMTRSQAEIQLLQEHISQGLRAKLENLVKTSDEKIAKYENEKAQIKIQAEGFQNEYERLNLHDDQFDMAEAVMSLAMAIFGISALTQKRWLFFFGLFLSITGTVFGLAGFLSWNLHPEWFARLIG